MDDSQTLFKPPPLDPSKSLIENLLELTSLNQVYPKLFTNTRPAWHPPGARGIFGGVTIAQCLLAANQTVPHNFAIHSINCFFLLAGNSNIPIIYHVECLREGKSFATRNVKAMQKEKLIFTSTISFVRLESDRKKLIEHAEPIPPNVPIPKDDIDDGLTQGDETGEWPYINRRIGIVNITSPNPHEKFTHQWVKARGKISASGSHQIHLAALAYMSDSYLIGVIPRVHNIWRFTRPPFTELILPGDDLWMHSKIHGEIPILDREERLENEDLEIGMMVTLNHTMFFHNPLKVRADEWMLTELRSHWAGDERGVAYQKIWTKDGVLIASCIQEAVIRLKQDDIKTEKECTSKL
ncbi:hypothetical protein B7463_g10252, partial [Scytalidium lignicola]